MISLFLATVIGWYLVITSVFLLFRHETLKSAMNDVLAQRGLLLILAIITLILGLLLVASHNIWVMGWPVVITLFAWLVLITGLLRLFLPDMAIKMGHAFLHHPVRMKIAGVVFLIIGLFLLYWAYFFDASLVVVL